MLSNWSLIENPSSEANSEGQAAGHHHLVSEQEHSNLQVFEFCIPQPLLPATCCYCGNSAFNNTDGWQLGRQSFLSWGGGGLCSNVDERPASVRLGDKLEGTAKCEVHLGISGSGGEQETPGMQATWCKIITEVKQGCQPKKISFTDKSANILLTTKLLCYGLC